MIYNGGLSNNKNRGKTCDLAWICEHDSSKAIVRFTDGSGIAIVNVSELKENNEKVINHIDEDIDDLL